MGTVGVKCDRPDQTKGDCRLQCEEVPCWHLNIQKMLQEVDLAQKSCYE